MRAVRFDQYGDVDVLKVVDVDKPSPGPGEIRIKVAVTAINPGEAGIRSGALDAMFPATFPSGQGSDIAGTIDELGAGVLGWDFSDDVIAWTDNRDAQAEYVVVPAEHVTIRPVGAPVEQAACLHVAGCTATALLSVGAVHPGETVVVTGAAGGVGCAVVQLLRRIDDVRVLAVAGPSNDDYLRSLGAEPVNYGDGLGHRLREAAPAGIDAVLDTHGGGYVQLAVGLGVAPDRVVTIIDFEGAERLGAKTAGGDDFASTALLAELAEYLTDGELTFPIAATYPLDEVRAAYTELAKGHTRGKIVLTV